MKKIVQTLILILATQAVFSQLPCQAAFTYYYDGTSQLYLYDASYNMDSTMISITAWNWSIQYAGTTYTYSIADPVIQINSVPAPVLVCLTIATGSGCTSSICDTVIINTQPTDCNADFIYQVNGFLNYYTFTDLSTAGNPASGATINSWYWIISDNLQNTLFTSTLQNPGFIFPQTGTYDVCLTIGTDSGCTDTQCYYLTIIDTTQNNCYLSYTVDISHVTVIGENDGYIDLAVTGGTPPYTFNWSNGATTEDIYCLTSGIYTVVVGQSDTLCPPYCITFEILEPYQNTPIDTLLTNPVDTCLNFTVDSFFVSSISVQGNAVVVTWIFLGGGLTGTLQVNYYFGNFGTYAVAITINCSKSSDTYMTYIYIASYLGTEDNCQAKVNIYPNPFTGSFNLNLPQEISDANVQIFNTSGRIIYYAKITDAGNTINASQWPAGIYYVRIISGKDQIITRNVIKQ
jgi:hypothetical protein